MMGSELSHRSTTNFHQFIFFSFKGPRGIPIIIPKVLHKPMKFLTDPKIRAACGVPEYNDFVFALPGGTAICISEAVRLISQNAALQCPDRVGCTLYRKYMATVVQV